MRSITRSSHWSIRATATAAVLALSGIVMAQQANPGAGPAKRMETSMTPAQAAALVKNAKHSLSDSISAAEKHCGGRAIRAECCNSSAAAGGAMCMVTILVGDNRLVEAAVNLQTGEVVSQRDVSGVSHFSSYRDDFAMARTWQKFNDLTGKKVSNTANEDLGKIEDIVVDAESGRILYGVLSFGGILGIGDKLFAIPWPALPLSGDEKVFVLNADKEQLKNASTFDKKQWPNFADEQFSTATYKYYNQSPYWESQVAEARPGSGKDGRTTISYRERWNQRATVWQKASDLSGKDVRNNQNEELGKLTDLVIDPQAGRILYGVLSSHGKFFAIPWPALRLSSDMKQLVVNINKEQLKDSISFGRDNWPNMADERWALETHTYYGVQPYWMDVQVERPQVAP